MNARTMLPAVALTCFAAGARVAAQQPTLRPRTVAEDLQLFSQVLNQIRVNHPDSVDTHVLFMAAVEGMLRAADPHSYVIPARRFDAEHESAMREGRLHPVPITFDYIGDVPVVVAVTPGSAASRLDIIVGDELVAIGGRPVQAGSSDELELVLAGSKGSTVELTFQRTRIDGSVATLIRSVRRERVEDDSAVPAAFMLDAETGYVRISTFATERAASDLRSSIERLERTGMKRLVLDMRDNAGGRIDEAASVAGAFLPAGTVVYTSEGRKADLNRTGTVKRAFWNTEKRFPMAVLINEGTASAAEVVAGALQDHERALVVGRPSFGKSLLMQGFPLTDGSVVVLVIGHLKTPCGRVIQRQYRGVRTREYFRGAGAEADTTGRPSCTTRSGRRVYGGGGIYPDVVLAAHPAPPLWAARAAEESLFLLWTGRFLDSAGASLTSPEALAADPRLPESVIADFRAFATSHRVSIPEDPALDRSIERALVLAVAYGKWGDAGHHRVAAALDPDVDAARTTLQR